MVTLFALLAPPALASHQTSAAQDRQSQIHRTKALLHHQILKSRNVTWRFEDKTGHERTRAKTIGWGYGTPLMRKVVHLWHDRAERARQHYLWHQRHDPAVRYAEAGFPPHHTLWMCLLQHEGGYWGNRDTGGNGHYGGLQMHPGWGYGTSYYASDDSQLTQEWAAEKGYAASGYAGSFLTQQWGQTIGYCT